MKININIDINMNIPIYIFIITTTITIIMGPFRFLLYAVHSGPRLHPLGGSFLQLTKAHCVSQTRHPALCREGYFTFVECRRRRITVCATIYDKNQMANLMNPKLRLANKKSLNHPSPLDPKVSFPASQKSLNHPSP